MSKMSNFQIVTSIIILLYALVQLNQSASIDRRSKTVCYYESWIHYRTGAGSMNVEDIDSSLCSHLVYAYFGIDSNSHELKFTDPYLEKDLHDLDKFVQAKGRAKAMISIGGAVNSDQFALVAANEQYLERFVDSVVAFLVKYQFDGVMIDWYHFEGKMADGFVRLLRKFDQKFASYAFVLGITIAEPLGNPMMGLNFGDFVEMVDFVNVLTFEYLNYPVHRAADSSPLAYQLETLSQLAKSGIPKKKLLMGVPFYARVWKLENGSVEWAAGPGAPGPYTNNPGLLSYNELCTMIKSSPDSFSIERKGNQWVHAIMVGANQTREFISYEEPKLLANKARNITLEGYGGTAVFTLANDDYRGVCGERYPLLRAIVQNYHTEAPEEVMISSTMAPKTTSIAPHKQGHGDPFVCTSEGKFVDATYCFVYYDCVKGELGALENTQKSCERHQFWDEKTQMCTVTKPASCI